MAGGTVFAEAGVPAIGVTCTNPQVTSDCDVYFRICFLDPFQGTVLANYAYKELGVDTAYLLGMLGSDYDQGLIYYFTQAFEKLGGKVVAENLPTSFPTSTTPRLPTQASFSPLSPSTMRS